MTIREELEIILQANDGHIKPQDIIDYAAENPDSALHKSLEWDDAKAGQRWRLVQARRIIQVHYVEVEPREDYFVRVREFVSLTPDRLNGGGYRPIGAVMANDELRAQAIRDAKRDADVFRRKYQHLQEVAPILDVMETVFEQAEEAA